MNYRLEETSMSPTNVCPMLSDATLSAVSEDILIDLFSLSLCDLFAAGLGYYSLQGLDKQLVATNEQLL
jgi:hypothetical protein